MKKVILWATVALVAMIVVPLVYNLPPLQARRLYSRIQERPDSVELCREFIERFPDSSYIPEVQALLSAADSCATAPSGS